MTSPNFFIGVAMIGGALLGTFVPALLLEAAFVEHRINRTPLDVQCTDGSRWRSVTRERVGPSWVLSNPAGIIEAIVPVGMCSATPVVVMVGK